MKKKHIESQKDMIRGACRQRGVEKRERKEKKEQTAKKNREEKETFGLRETEKKECNQRVIIKKESLSQSQRT